MRFDEGEDLIYVVRKHWLVFAGNVLVIAFGAILPIIVLRLLPGGVLSALSLQNAAELLAFLYVLWLLFLWQMFFILWTTYYLNVVVVTNQHIIDIRQGGLFSRELTTARLEKVKDVTIDTEGLLQTIFRMGNLTIETAGESENIKITQAADPERARKAILGAHSGAAGGGQSDGI